MTQFLVHHGVDGVDGYAAYRLQDRWQDHMPQFILTVQDVVASSRTAELEIWRHLLGHDLVETVRAGHRPVDEPLVRHLTDPRRLRRGLSDGLHLHVVDVAAALAGRRYGREDGVTLRVVDPMCPWVEGSYRLEGGLDGATAVRTERAPDLVLDAASLGAVLLGGSSVESLHRSGALDETTPGAALRATAMFSWSPRPWSPGFF